MIYELLIRSAGKNTMSSDNLVWIDANLTTRGFEKWMMDRSLLNKTGDAPVARWSIMQTVLPAQFMLETDTAALEHHISDLMNGTQEINAVPDAVKALRIFQLSAEKKELAEVC
ncbi:hypothetical protein [Undibacterium sp. Xuan67W]|uniref:hypothetical protein n=1 Tax=Undibacterium sp. Xuan67W TaxID=3413057 RepID=UPI003BEF5725